MRRLASVLTLALAIWLFFSGFTWPHSLPQLVNAAILGLLVMIISGGALVQPGLRRLNVLLGGWLLFFTLSAPRLGAATTWNNTAVGVAVIALSLLPLPAPRRTASSRRSALVRRPLRS